MSKDKNDVVVQHPPRLHTVCVGLKKVRWMKSLAQWAGRAAFGFVVQGPASMAFVHLSRLPFLVDGL